MFNCNFSVFVVWVSCVLRLWVVVLFCILVVGFIGMLIRMWVEFVVIFFDSMLVISWLLLLKFSGCWIWIRMLLVGFRCMLLFYMM